MSAMSAFVARTTFTTEPIFLAISPSGEHDWVQDPSRATPFPSVREATRLALRLPSRFRAYGLLRRCEGQA